MAKGEEKHRSKVRKHKAHKPGCIIRCITTYKEGDPCSHRWNAAEQARGESLVPYMTTRKRMNIGDDDERMQSLLDGGAIVPGSVVAKAGKPRTALFEPFVRAYAPFPHNAHHIVPVGVHWNALERISKMGAPRETVMLNQSIGALLKDEYNMNAQVNMIVLPTENWAMRKLGLPLHLEGKQQAHPKYSSQVRSIVMAKLPNKFKSLADQVKAKKHYKQLTLPEVKDLLESISKATYKAIIAIAVASKTGGKLGSIDALSKQIAKAASKALGK